MAADACRSAKVPVALHLDHCQDVVLGKYTASLPFDSIMVDMSHYDKRENLELTKQLTKFCHERVIATEAEPGCTEGREDGVASTAELEGITTTPEEALEFASTGIDFLAPAFGNVHGPYGSGGPIACLQLNRLQAVRKAVGGQTSLVLHGSGDFTRSIYQECIATGISKINVNVQLIEPWHDMILARREYIPLTSMIGDSIDVFQRQVSELMDMLGSVNKAKN